MNIKVVPNSLIDCPANWDSLGKKKLSQMAQMIVDNFSETEIGEEILERLDTLESEIYDRLGRNVAFVYTEGLDNTSNLFVSLKYVPTSIENYFLINSSVYIFTNAASLNFAITMTSDVPLVEDGGTIVVRKYDSSFVLLSTEFITSTSLPGAVISTDAFTSYVTADFKAGVYVNADAEIRITQTGDATGSQSVLAGTQLIGTLANPLPIIPPV